MAKNLEMAMPYPTRRWLRAREGINRSSGAQIRVGFGLSRFCETKGIAALFRGFREIGSSQKRPEDGMLINRSILSRALRVLSLFSMLCPLAFWLGSCSVDYIPDTKIEDTPENRDILTFIDGYRRAVEGRDLGAVLAMTSKNYYDDMGTPIGSDDVDYDTLQKGIDRLKKDILAARFQINYRGITFVENRILVDILYTGWFQINTDQGPQWRRKLEAHRLVIVSEDGGYRILSGL
jgi:hypothetical protein